MTAAAMEDHHGRALACVQKDPNVDGIVHLSVPPSFLRNELLAQETVKGMKGATKPVTVCYMAGEPLTEARRILERDGIPTFDMPEQAARAMTRMILRSRMVKSLANRAHAVSPGLPAETVREVRDMLAGMKTAGRNPTEPEARAALAKLGVPLLPAFMAGDSEEAARMAADIGYPVVAKIVSADILHKSDVGGVRVGLCSAQEVTQAYDDMVRFVRSARPEAAIEGVLVMQQAREGTEMIAGAKRDPQFGPVVMAGFGGVLVEVLQDVAFRVVPFSAEDAAEMLDELRLHPVLNGVRGGQALDSAGFGRLLVRLGEIMSAVPEIQEIDLNPVRLYPTGLAILDASMIV